VDPSVATKLILTSDEYKNIGIIMSMTKAYKETALAEEILINTHIDIINNLKELVALEQKKSKDYRELYINSENLYRQEVWEHKWDNRINGTMMYLVTFGSILLIGL
jgi:hypothetical protein